MPAQVQFLIFSLDERSFALHLSQVLRVIRAVDVTPLPQAPPIVLGAIDLHGTIIPLMDTAPPIRIPRKELAADDVIIIARTSKQTIGLAADRVMDVVLRPAQEIVATEKILPGLDRIEGVLQLEDGLVLIHDLDRFLSLDEQHVLDQAPLDRALSESPTHE